MKFHIYLSFLRMQPCCVMIPFIDVDDVLSSGRLERRGFSGEDNTPVVSSTRDDVLPGGALVLQFTDAF